MSDQNHLFGQCVLSIFYCLFQALSYGLWPNIIVNIRLGDIGTKFVKFKKVSKMHDVGNTNENYNCYVHNNLL